MINLNYMPKGVYKHKPLSEKQKQKIRRVIKKLHREGFYTYAHMKGNKLRVGKEPWSKGKRGLWKGNKTSFKKGQNKGRNNVKWIDGRTPESQRIRHSVEMRLWREAVFARDDWICQKCNKRGGKLHPHHIRNFAEIIELRTSIENGMTLCKDCHQKFHKKYGIKHNNLNQLIEFLK